MKTVGQKTETGDQIPCCGLEREAGKRDLALALLFFPPPSRDGGSLEFPLRLFLTAHCKAGPQRPLHAELEGKDHVSTVNSCLYLASIQRTVLPWEFRETF